MKRFTFIAPDRRRAVGPRDRPAQPRRRHRHRRFAHVWRVGVEALEQGDEALPAALAHRALLPHAACAPGAPRARCSARAPQSRADRARRVTRGPGHRRRRTRAAAPDSRATSRRSPPWQSARSCAVTAVTAQTDSELRAVSCCRRRWCRRRSAQHSRRDAWPPSRPACSATAPSSRRLPQPSLRGARVPLVLDPVLAATSGGALLDGTGRAALAALLLPRATLLTPNIPEAARLLGAAPASSRRGDHRHRGGRCARSARRRCS